MPLNPDNIKELPFLLKFDANRDDGTSCHFVAPIATYEEARNIQEQWFCLYRDCGVVITTSVEYR